MVLSWAATVKVENGKHENEVMISDVRRAHFYARASRNLFIELPDEDPNKGSGMVGKSNLCLYGTRDAAKSWQQTLTGHLKKQGFSFETRGTSAFSTMGKRASRRLFMETTTSAQVRVPA